MDKKYIYKDGIITPIDDTEGTEVERESVQEKFKKILNGVRSAIKKEYGEETSELIADDPTEVVVETPIEVVEEEVADEKTVSKAKEFLKRNWKNIIILVLLGALGWNLYHNIKNYKTEDVLADSNSVSSSSEANSDAVEDVIEKPEVTVDAALLAEDYYSYLLDLESRLGIKFNLPNGKDSILNVIYALNPELGEKSNIDIAQTSTICNDITANCYLNNQNSNISTLLVNGGEELKQLDEMAAKLGRDVLSSDTEVLGEDDSRLDDDKAFYTELDRLTQLYSADDINNLPMYVIIDAIYNGASGKLVNYLNASSEAVKKDVDFRNKETVIFGKLDEYEYANQVDTVEQVAGSEIEQIANNYYNLLLSYESEYGVRFENVNDLNTIVDLVKSLNGEDGLSIDAASKVMENIAITCKSINALPKFDTLVKNGTYSNLLNNIENKLSKLKVDINYDDDRDLYQYLAENIVDTSSRVINTQSLDQAMIFMAVMADYEAYSDEVSSYCYYGKNGEFLVNGKEYFACAQAIDDTLKEYKSDILVNESTLVRSK